MAHNSFHYFQDCPILHTIGALIDVTVEGAGLPRASRPGK